MRLNATSRATSSLSLDPTSFHGLTLATFFAASAAPTPLYRLYQESFALSPVLITIVFAVYAVALLKALLVVGSLSDHLGRKPVIFGALLLEAAAMALFLVADGSGWLIAARIVQGLATGIAAASLGAALVDIDQRRGSFLNAIAPFLGMAAGAIGTSALIQYGPFPLHLVYGLLLGLFAAQALAIWLTPETGARRPGALRSMWPRIAVPPQARAALLRITPINVATWALGGFYLSLVPSLVVATTGDRAPLTSGTMVCGLMLAGGVSMSLRRSRDPLGNVTLGVTFVTLGTATVVAGVHLASVAVLVLGTLFSGVGFGTTFLGSVGSVLPLAKAGERAELLSAFYVQSYLAFSIPAVLAGYLIGRLGYAATADIYAAVITALSLLGLFWLRIGAARSAERPAAG